MQVTPEVFDSARNDLHSVVNSLLLMMERVAVDAAYHHSGGSHNAALSQVQMHATLLWKKASLKIPLWVGRIFDESSASLLPDGRTALRDVVRHPGASYCCID